MNPREATMSITVIFPPVGTTAEHPEIHPTHNIIVG